MPAFALRVSKIVSSRRISAPPSMRPRACSSYASRKASKVVRPERRIVDVRGNRQRAVRRPHRAGNEARAIRRLGVPLVAGGPRQARAFQVQFIRQRFERVVRLHDRRAAERVGLDDVGAGCEILMVDLADHVGPRQDQQVVVPLHILGVILQPLAAEIRLGQRVALDHRAHRAVEEEDARRERSRSRTGDRVSRHVVASSSASSAGDQDGERIARATRADRYLHLRQSCAFEEPLQFVVVESQPSIAEPLADPVLVVTPQIEEQHAAARTHDAHGFGQRL